jgi:hypothetical protein
MIFVEGIPVDKQQRGRIVVATPNGEPGVPGYITLEYVADPDGHTPYNVFIEVSTLLQVDDGRIFNMSELTDYPFPNYITSWDDVRVPLTLKCKTPNLLSTRIDLDLDMTTRFMIEIAVYEKMKNESFYEEIIRHKCGSYRTVSHSKQTDITRRQTHRKKKHLNSRVW